MSEYRDRLLARIARAEAMEAKCAAATEQHAYGPEFIEAMTKWQGIQRTLRDLNRELSKHTNNNGNGNGNGNVPTKSLNELLHAEMKAMPATPIVESEDNSSTKPLTYKQYRKQKLNRKNYDKLKEAAGKRYDEMIAALGGLCDQAFFGGCNGDLVLDHRDGDRDWKNRDVSSVYRIKKLEEDFAAGRLRVLCWSHNSSDGAKRQARQRRRKRGEGTTE